MRANVVLHDTRRPSRNGPPHDSPPKFLRNWLMVLGSGICVSVGYDGLVGVIPFCSAIDAVTTLNVEPGK